MRVSQLIQKLQEAQRLYGDLPVGVTGEANEEGVFDVCGTDTFDPEDGASNVGTNGLWIVITGHRVFGVVPEPAEPPPDLSNL